MKENCLVKKELSKEEKCKLRCDEREGSRHIKIRTRSVPGRGNSMFLDKRKSLVCGRNQKNANTGAYG